MVFEYIFLIVADLPKINVNRFEILSKNVLLPEASTINPDRVTQ